MKKLKKIAFIIRYFQKKSFHGGGEKLFFNLIKRLKQNNWEIHVYCSVSDIPNGDEVDKVFVIDEPYDHLKPKTMEKFYAQAKKLIQNENYTYVVSENITPPVDITFLQGHSLEMRLKRDKNFFEKFLYNFRKIKLERMKYHKKWMREGYRKIFVVSEVLKKDIVENFGVPEDKIAVIYPGVNLPENTDLQNSSSSKTPVFGLCAPGFKIKGGYIFLKALSILKNKGYHFKAKIIYPKYKKNIWVRLFVKFLRIGEQVEFLPFQQDMPEFYHSVDAIVAPSIEDTFNLVVLEAMANSKFCIVSSNAGASEIIKDEKNGFVFYMSKNPSENLAEKMILYINKFPKFSKDSQNSNLCQSARNTAEFFTWNKTFEQFINELEMI